MSANPNGLRDLMRRVLSEAVKDDICTDSEADALEHVFEGGMNWLGYV